MDYTMWNKFILKKLVSLGFRLGRASAEGGWANSKLCDLCPLQREHIADKFFFFFLFSFFNDRSGRTLGPLWWISQRHCHFKYPMSLIRSTGNPQSLMSWQWNVRRKKITRKRLIEHSRKAFSTILLGEPDKNLTDLNPFWPASFSKVASLALEGLGDLSVHVQSN